MGYTHYWYQDGDFSEDQWSQIRNLSWSAYENWLDFIHSTDSESELFPLASWDGKNLPEFTDLDIAFNGRGKDGHESFVLPRCMPDPKEKQPWRVDEGHPDYFAFCKTAQKPYDTMVAAVLLIANHVAPEVIRYDSDGDVKEWEAPVMLASKVIGSRVSFNPMLD